MAGMAVMGVSMCMPDLAHARNEQWAPLQLWKPQYPGLKEFAIAKPGKYMLAEDEIQRRRFWTGNGLMSPDGGNLISIYCGSVEIDLRGHMVGSDFQMTGASLLVALNVRFAKNIPENFTSASLDNRFVTLKNGTIDMARGEMTNSAVAFYNRWDDDNRRTVARPVDGHRAVLEKIDYERNEYCFEKLKLLANDTAIIVEGSHTVIRDCIIESADAASIFIAGNNVTIENCEIRLRRFRFERTNQPRAAIVLRDGSNGVIRNNRIRIDDDERTRDQTHGILVGDGARDVLVEGNTFINAGDEPVKLMDGAQALVRDNKFEKSRL